MENILLTARSSPHIRTKNSTQGIMRDVIIALLPVTAMGVYHFGWYVLAIIATSVITAVLTEFLYAKLTKRPQTVTDGSAVITGLLLALSLTPTIPLWIPAIGAFFGILIVKCIFGGIGQNFVNPALAARAFLMASWPAQMTIFVNSNHMTDAVSTATDAATSATGAVVDGSSVATMLSGLQNNLIGWPENASVVVDKLIGHSSGTIGEVSIFAILLGAAYLLVRRVIRLEAPLAYLGSFAFFAWMWIGQSDQLFSGNILGELLFGGVIFAAVFMVTDYTTTPMTTKGQLIFGLGAGFITAVIRAFGAYPEGVTYAILLMNLAVPLIDRVLVPRAFGRKKVKDG